MARRETMEADMEEIVKPEEWTDITGTDRYEISSLGKVRNKKTGKMLKPGAKGFGYLYVDIKRNGLRKSAYVHVLVAEHFLGHKPNGSHKLHVAHKDHDKHNNRVDNLEIQTMSENMRAGDRKGVRRKLNPSKVKQMFWMRAKGDTIDEIAKAMGTTPRNVRSVLCRFSWKHVDIDPYIEEKVAKSLELNRVKYAPRSKRL